MGAAVVVDQAGVAAAQVEGRPSPKEAEEVCVARSAVSDPIAIDLNI
jgi:hypothetical protein